MEFKVDPKWRFQIEGDEGDISELERLVMANVSNSNSILIWRPDDIVRALTCSAWDSMNGPEAFDAAEAALRVLSGAMRMHRSGKPLSLGTIYEVTADGRLTMSRQTRLAIYVVPQQAQSTDEFKFLLARADEEEWLTGALVELSQMTDWFAIYRIIEAMERHFGNKEGALMACPLVDGKTLKLVKRMANCQSAFKSDPLSARKRDPLAGWSLR